MYKVALWGLGGGYDFFTSLHGHELVDVIAVADGGLTCMGGTVDGIPLVVPNELLEIPFDYLIVSVLSDLIYKEIVQQAQEIGIKREVILPLRIFQIPFFNFDDYIKIKESNLSIVSDYCFAGFLYHKFGLRFTSPTINMFADNENYFRFISDMDTYMSMPMTEVEDIINHPYGIYVYPRGRLADVEWIFNHDITFDTAEARWKKGVQRFNWNNYMVIMTINSDEMAYKFDALPIKNKIGFYWKDLHLDSIICTPQWNEPSFRAKMAYTYHYFINKIAIENNGGVRAVNWMKALLHQEGFRR